MRFTYIAVLGATALLLSSGTVRADQLTATSFGTDFEPASGYGPGRLTPDAVWPYVGNQPYVGTNLPRWEEKWLPGFNRLAVEVTTARAHTGTQAIEFTGVPGGGTDVISQVAHVGMLDGSAGAPLSWIERFSVYVPSTLSDPRALRVEPFNNFPGQGFMYQLALYTRAAGAYWRPELNNGSGVFNDLRGELGRPDGFETDRWWTVSITADGAAHVIRSISIADDVGNVYTASGLSEPFGLGLADRPERLNYFGADGVLLDDISVIPEPGALALLALGGLLAARRR